MEEDYNLKARIYPGPSVKEATITVVEISN